MDSERLGRFLALTGLSPDTIRREAKTSRFLAAILDYVAADEQLLVAIAAELGVGPDAIVAAHRRLAPPPQDDP